MKTKVILFVLLLTFAQAVFAQTALAQEKADPAYDKIVPLIKENTFLVAHIDLQKIESDAFFDKFEKRSLRFAKETFRHFGLPNAPFKERDVTAGIRQSKESAKEVLEAFSQAGVDELYLLSAMEITPSCLFLIALPGQAQIPASVDESLREMFVYPGGMLDGMTFYVVAGQPAEAIPKFDAHRVVKHYGVLPVKKRPEFKPAFELQAKSPIRIVFAPSNGVRSLIRTSLAGMFAQSPVPVDRDWQRTFMAAVNTTQSISIGVTPKDLRLNIAARLTTDKAAQETADSIVKMYDAMKEQLDSAFDAFPAEFRSNFQQIFEDIDPILQDLLPKANRNLLVVVVNEKFLDKHEKGFAKATGNVAQVAMTFLGMQGDAVAQTGSGEGDLFSFDESGETDSAYGKIAPYVGENTLFVAHLDLDRLDVDAAAEKIKGRITKLLDSITQAAGNEMELDADALGSMKEEFETEFAAGKESVDSMVQVLKDAGITEFYIITNFDLLQFYPAILVVPGSVTLPEDILESMEIPAIRAGENDSMTFYMIAADPAGMDRNTVDAMFKQFLEQESASRPEIGAAFALQSESPIRLVVSLPAPLKMMAQMFLPAVAAEAPIPLDMEKLNALIQNTLSISMGINPAEFKLNYTIQMPTNQAAEETGEFLRSFYDQALDTEDTPMPPEMREQFKTIFMDFLPKAQGNRLVFEFDETFLDKYEGPIIGMFLPAVTAAREAARRMQCTNNIKQLTIGLHNYHDTIGALPPLYTVDANGKALHSWRVLILPFIEEQRLYDQIKMDEPWDSEHNSQFHDKVLSVFACPSNKNVKKGKNCCYAVIAGETFIPAKKEKETKGNRLQDITDGTSNTIAIVEVTEPFCWMDPTKDVTLEELQKGINKPEGRVGSSHPMIANFGFMDGSVRALSNFTPSDVLKALGTCSGGEVVTLPEF